MDSMILKKEIIQQTLIKARSERRLTVVAGLRRTGKTTILQTAMQEMRTARPPVRIVHVEAESEEWTGRRLVNEAKALGVGPSALVIDNADCIAGLAEALAEIERRHAPWMLVSGKRTQELEASLSGLFSPLVVRVRPFSYLEFLAYAGLNDTPASVQLYARAGGLPENLACIGDEELSRRIRFLSADSFILTEILENGPVRNPRQLRKVVSLAVRHSGESLPSRQICAALASERITISPQSAVDYLEAARVSGLLVPIPVYDISKRKILDTSPVWFCSDAGFREPFLDVMQGTSKAESDRSIENLLFLALESEFGTVYRGRTDLDSKHREEVSFVCEGSGKRVYIQFCGSSPSAAAYERKKRALLAIRDGWSKILVESGQEGTGDDGILSVSPRTLLAEGVEAALRKNAGR